MSSRIDTSRFPVGKDLDYEAEEERRRLAALTDEAWNFVRGWRWDPPVAELMLAFAVAPILGLFLMRFAPGGRPEDAERWVVVGDLPAMHFETDEARTPARALELCCAIAEDWADGVLAGRDLSDSYPFPIDPTRANAESLLDRVEFIRENLIPLAWRLGGGALHRRQGGKRRRRTGVRLPPPPPTLPTSLPEQTGSAC